MVEGLSHDWVTYSIWPGERLMWVCWTTHTAKWSNTNALDTKLKISLSCRTPSVTIQKHGLPDLQFLPKMESQDWITWRLCYQPTGAHPLQFPLFQNRIWQRRIRIWKCMRKKSFVEGRQWRQKYQGIWIHFPLFKTLNCSAPRKSCMQHGVMIML